MRWLALGMVGVVGCGPTLLGGVGEGSADGTASGEDDDSSDDGQSTGMPWPTPDVPPVPPLSCGQAPVQSIGEPVIVDTGVPSSNGAAFWDPERGRVLVFGGLRGSGLYFDDVLAIDPVRHASSTLLWADGPTFDLTDVAAAYDPAAHRWYFVGGEHGGGLIQQVLEVFAIDHSTLGAASLPALPSEVTRHAAGYDVDARRVVYAGGWDGFPPDTDYRNETWSLQGGSWQLLEGGSAPPPTDEIRLQGIPTFGIVAVAPIDPENSIERGLWLLPTGAEEWQSLPTSSSFASGSRFSLLWDEGSCTLLVWDWGTEGTVWRIDPFASPATVVELDRPRVPELDVLYGPNLAFVPDLRMIVLHGGANYEEIDSVYSERAALYPAAP